MTIPFRERLACTVLQAEEATGLSRNRIYELIKSGELDAIKDGKLRFIKIASLVKLLDERSPRARELLDDQQLNDSVGKLIRGAA
jgi:excisionase family DNA binding protein